MILYCTCSHAYQDQIHGKGKRVHNLCKKDTHARCTVCKRETQLSAAVIKDLKKEDK